jgi:hypothetical protein
VNIALPAVAIILGLLPGIVFYASYFSGRFAPSDKSATSEFAQYLLFAIPLNALAYLACRGLGIDLEYGLIARVITGTGAGDTPLILAGVLRRHLFLSVGTYFAILAASMLLGNLTRRVIWAFRLDTRFKFLRTQNDWYYLVQGRHSSLPRGTIPNADILVQQPGRSQLFTGIVTAVEVTRDGAIREIVLKNAKRGRGRGYAFNWKEIPGNRFVIVGSSIISINMNYALVEPAEKPSASRRFKLWLRAVWNAFWRQVP